MTAPTLTANDPCHCGSGRKYKRCHRIADLDPERVAAEQARKEDALREAERWVRPGKLSPRREVPESIERPPYAHDPKGRPGVRESSAPKDAATLEKMRRAGRAAAEVLAAVGAAVRPGI